MSAKASKPKRKKAAPSVASQRKRGKKRVRGRPFLLGNTFGFKPGQSGNPKGNARSLLLSTAYRKMLATPASADTEAMMLNMIEEGASWADIIALAQIIEAAKGKTPAAAEIRQSTEGNSIKVRTWRDDVIDLLRARTLNADTLRAELGDELAEELIQASGISEQPSGSNKSDDAATVGAKTDEAGINEQPGGSNLSSD